MVEDKANKMRESLRLMSLSKWSYALSIVLFQACFAIVSSLIMGAFVYNNDGLFPNHTQNDSLIFICLLVILYVAQIPFTMALSTFFTDAKVANSVGGLIMAFPAVIFIQITQLSGNLPKMIYLLYWMPIFPAMTIICSLTTANYLPPDFLVMKTSMLSLPFAWTTLILATPLWILGYIYLDAVMPNTYGVKRHPCFCCKRSDRNKKFTEFGGH